MLSCLAAAAVFGALVAPPTAGGQVVNAEPGDHVRLRVVPPPGVPFSRTRLQGTLVRVEAESLSLRVGRGARSYAMRDVHRLEVRSARYSRREGALRYGLPAAALGALGGALLASQVEIDGDCALTPGGSCEEPTRFPAAGTAAAFGLLFGTVGAAHGATAGRWTWRRVPLLGPRVGLSLTPSSVAFRVISRPRLSR